MTTCWDKSPKCSSGKLQDKREHLDSLFNHTLNNFQTFRCRTMVEGWNYVDLTQKKTPNETSKKTSYGSNNQRHSRRGATNLSQLKSQECPVGAGVWLAGVHAGCAARTVNLDHRLVASPRCSPKYPSESAAAAASTTAEEPPAIPQISLKVFLYDIL